MSLLNNWQQATKSPTSSPTSSCSHTHRFPPVHQLCQPCLCPPCFPLALHTKHLPSHMAPIHKLLLSPLGSMTLQDLLVFLPLLPSHLQNLLCKPSHLKCYPAFPFLLLSMWRDLRWFSKETAAGSSKPSTRLLSTSSRCTRFPSPSLPRSS